MKDYITLGSSPVNEFCAQVGEDDYLEKAREESQRYLDLLKKKFGPEPEGARLSVKSFAHDFGTYHEVVCWYDESFPKSADYAFDIEGNLPLTWEG